MIGSDLTWLTGEVLPAVVSVNTVWVGGSCGICLTAGIAQGRGGAAAAQFGAGLGLTGLAGDFLLSSQILQKNVKNQKYERPQKNNKKTGEY